EDADGGGLDLVGLAATPAGDVADAVGAGVEVVQPGDDVGDRFGFELAGGLVGFAGELALVVGVQDGVRGLVDGGFGGVGVGEVIVNDDAAGSVDGAVAVHLAGDLLAGDGPSLTGHPLADALVEGGVVVALELGDGGAGLLDALDGVSLGDVEH